MAGRARPNLTLLALATASGLLFGGEGLKPLVPFHLAALRGQEPQRASRILDQMVVQKSAFGLGSQDGLKETSHFTDLYGKTHVHFEQTYHGVKVWNSHLIGHMDASGAFEPAHATVHANIQLEPAVLIGQDRMRELVARQLPKAGRIKTISFEQVVFPTQYQEGLKLAPGKDGRTTLDARFSVATPQKNASHVWAYHASAMQVTKKGLEATEFILDGRTGEVLAKWDGLDRAAAPGTPARGSGLGHWNGLGNPVALDMEQLADGTYTLNDLNRGTQPWPNTSPDYAAFAGHIGNATLGYNCEASYTGTGFYPFSSTDKDGWGDGNSFWGVWDAWDGLDHPADKNYQTGAVDAHYAVQTTWDYYTNVLGRTGGIDGKSSSILTIVNVTDEGASPISNAFWSPSLFVFGIGYDWSGNAYTSLDIMAHEYSHGVFSYTANLKSSEGKGINEANSDIHAAMARFWLWGADGKGDTVPDTVTKSPIAAQNSDPKQVFTIGAQVNDGEPFRTSYKPSLDFSSPNSYFAGMGTMLDSHNSMGPANRAFYFLAQGASSDATQDTYSEFLPSGMQGIGNDKAIKLWYHAMATKVTDPASGYYEIRDVMIASAKELHGDNSPEVAAVQNAFAAISVGGAAGENATARVQLTDPAGATAGSGYLLVAPCAQVVALPLPTVTNAQDLSYTWKVGSPVANFDTGGKILDNAYYVAPTPRGASIFGNTVVSNQNYRARAALETLVIPMDTDLDAEFDACDMAPLAVSYGKVDDIYTSQGTVPMVPEPGDEDGYVWDNNLAAFLIGFRNVFNSPYVQK